MPSFYNLKDFFQPIDTAEATEFIAQLKDTATKDIWMLIRMDVDDLGFEVDRMTAIHFDKFWTTFKDTISDIIQAVTPVDPNDLTPEEQEKVSAFRPSLLAVFPNAKHGALLKALELMDNQYANDYLLFSEIKGTTAANGRLRMDRSFFDLLAGYYLITARQYVSLNVKTYRFLGRVEDSNTLIPKAGVNVSCVDKALTTTTRTFGSTTTDRNGYYRIDFTVLDGLSTDYDLEFTFDHAELSAPQVVTLTYDFSDPLDPVMSQFNFQTIPSTSSTVASTGILIPADVEAYLTANNITINRLDDIRQLGSFKNLPGVNSSNADLLKLDGLASLEIISGDLGKSGALYDRGYTGISRIASKSRHSFVRDNRDILGDLEAGRIHYQAQAAHLLGLNLFASEMTPAVRGDGDQQTPLSGNVIGCGCEDCTSAVSPIAYLADLLNFCINNLEHDAPGGTSTLQPVTLTFLKDTYKHEFGDLPASCDQLKTSVCQNRIATEILWKYHESLSFPNNADLEDARQLYLRQTYELLLERLGTNYNGIRKLRAIQPTDDKKKEVADRLGIVLNDGVITDTLEELYWDLSEGQTHSETDLESLFGIRDSERNTLTATPVSKVAEWKSLRLREIWKEQHRPRNPYWDHQAVIVDPDVVTVDDLRIPQAGQLEFDLWLHRRTWVDDQIAAFDHTDMLDANGRLQDAFKGKKLIVAYDLTNASTIQSFTYTGEDIDGNTLAAVIFNVDQQIEAGGNTYFLLDETVAVDGYNGTFTGGLSHTNAADILSADEMVARMLTSLTYNLFGTSAPIAVGWVGTALDVPDPIAALKVLHDAASSDPEPDTYLQSLTDAGLTLATSARLLELYTKHKEDPLAFETNGNLTDAEWNEFQDLLVSCLKAQLSSANGAWTGEESAIDLSAAKFWQAVRQPKPGFFGHEEVRPLVDPSSMSIADLPEITAREKNKFANPGTPPPADIASLDLFLMRKDELATFADTVRTGLDGDFIDILLVGALYGNDYPGTPPVPATDLEEDLQEIYDQLLDPATSDIARVRIEDMDLIVDDFRYLYDLKGRHDNGEVIAETDVIRLISILQQVMIERSDWKTEEQNIDHWILRKARLPKWLASFEQRSEWLRALEENNNLPTIDADLIGPGSLKDPAIGDHAYDLWQDRVDERDAWISALNAEISAGLPDAAAFNALTKTHLGHAEPSLQFLRDEQEDGVDIRPRLAQLKLTIREFDQLINCSELVDINEPLKEDEKLAIAHILTAVKKRRKYFAYLLEEILPSGIDPFITLSQDHFKLPKDDYSVFPPIPDRPLDQWLASERDLIAWRQQLKGRIEQEKAVLDAWQETLMDVDDTMIIHLRDALVKACGDSDLTIAQNARIIGDRLLTDLENNCCYRSNRVAAAIETLQQLLWKTRTGDILADHPTMEFVGEDFDDAWTWMGSYANWRAAMFVFLYPENVLIPSLRKDQTPAFRAVIEATRSNRRFNPDSACSIAREYSAYIHDVASLDLKCVGQAEMFLRETGCNNLSTISRRYDFVFAQSKISNKTYYTLVDPGVKDALKQDRFWLPVDAISDKASIFGCDIQYPGSDGRFFYVFYQIVKLGNEDKFYALRFDLDAARWEDEPLEFQISVDDLKVWSFSPDPSFVEFEAKHFSPNIRAIAIRQKDHAGSIGIAVSLSKVEGIAKDEYTFYWFLHDNGKELKPRWNNDGWRLCISGNVALRGRVKSSNAIAAGHDYDYSLLVISREHSTSVNEAWTVWRAAMNTLQAYYNLVMANVSNPFGLTSAWDSVTAYYGSRESFIYLWQNHPSSEPPRFIEMTGVPSDYLAFIEIFGGTAPYEDKTALYWLGQGRSVKAIIPYYDRQTFHIEYSTLGGESAAAVVRGQDDPGTPLQISELANSHLTLTAYGSIVMPVWQNRIADPGGEVIYIQEAVDNTRIRARYFTKNYVQNDPVTSTITGVSGNLWLTPKLSGPPLIQQHYTKQELSVRQQMSQADLVANINPNFRLAEYIAEAYYFVPMQIALQLAANGHYLAALDWFRSVYDQHRPPGEKKIWYGLKREETLQIDMDRAEDWYRDPLNPHAIAAIRPQTYTRYTILSIVYCILDYADSEFTIDNSETVPRARELYEDAIALLQMLIPDPCPEDAAIPQLQEAVQDKVWKSTWKEVIQELEHAGGYTQIDELITDIQDTISGPEPIAVRIQEVRTLIGNAINSITSPTMETVVTTSHDQLSAVTSAALGGVEQDSLVNELATQSAREFTVVVEAMTGRRESELALADIPWLYDRAAEAPTDQRKYVDPISPTRTQEVSYITGKIPSEVFQINSSFPNVWILGTNFSFCVVSNPIVKGLLMRAEVNLYKIHNCMNIAGMVRKLDPFAAPTDSTTGIPVIGVNGGGLTVPTDRQLPPSPYRYRVIADRAKQLVSMAQQIEAAFLSTLEKLDAERYSVLRADQDIETSKANIKLQDLKVKEANSGVTLAELQKERSVIQLNHFEGLLSQGNSGLEIAALAFMSTSIALQYAASIVYASAAVEAGTKALFDNVTEKAAKVVESLSSAASSSAGLFQMLASFERRREEWEFQKTLANHDVNIGAQQVTIAQQRLQIVGQERAIADIQLDHARTTKDFLKNKFTNAELYEWMSGVLEDVYAWFLQEATSMAILAQRQLAFERQVDLPPFVRTDYWVVDPNALGGGASISGEVAIDRRGLTGSARLIKDLYELDQYGFHISTPKLQMNKTISINEIAPEELMRLRDTGILNIRTTHELFDRDYPGHYLRLIKKVNVSVIALNSPIRGIRATLTNGGVSRVITGGAIFQERIINRLPEQIALSGGVSDYGVFQLRGEGEFLDPFEGTGVDTAWEFRMEKAANPFDYQSIADVLITIEYEAMSSFTYRQVVTQRLNSEGQDANLALSFKNNLPDQWFDLNNPEQVATPFNVSFDIGIKDLAPNILNPRIGHVSIYFLMKQDGNSQENFNQIVTLGYGALSGLQATPNEDNFISTRANSQGFGTLIGANGPTGAWTFALANSVRTRLLFENKEVEDILMVIGYKGDTVKYSL